MNTYTHSKRTHKLHRNHRAKYYLGVVICSFFIKVLNVNAVTLRESYLEGGIPHGSEKENC